MDAQRWWRAATWVALGWLLCLQPTCPDAWAAPAPPAQAGIPFDLVNHGIVVTVPTRQGELHMLLDTGAAVVILTQAAQRSLHLSVRPTGVQEGDVRFSIGEINDVHLGAVTLPRLPFYTNGSSTESMMEIWSKQHPESRIDGLLGVPAYRDLAVGLDMREHRILFWNRGNLSTQAAARFLTPASKNDTASTLHAISCSVDAGGLHIPLKVGAVATSLTLDTGAAMNVAGPRLAAYLYPITSGFNTNMERVYRADTGVMVALSSLNIDGEIFACPWVTVYGKLDPQLDCGILGLDILQDCRFIVDIPGRKLFLVREKNVETQVHEKLFQWGFASLRTPKGSFGFPCTETVQNTGLRPQDVVVEFDHRLLDQVLDWNSGKESVMLTYMRMEAGAAVRKEILVAPTSLQSAGAVAAKTGGEFVLLPNERVIYNFPNGALYVPPSYKGAVDQTGKSAPLRMPTGGLILPNAGPNTANAIRMKAALDIDNAGTSYLHEPDRPVEIQPGYYWGEILNRPQNGVFRIAPPLKEPYDTNQEFESR